MALVTALMENWKWIESGKWFCHGKVPATDKEYYTVRCELVATHWFKSPIRSEDGYLVAYCDKCFKLKRKYDSVYGAPMGIPKTIDSYERMTEEEAEVFIIMSK